MRESFSPPLTKIPPQAAAPCGAVGRREHSQTFPNAPPSSQYKENERTRLGEKRDKMFKDAVFLNLVANRTIYGGKGTFVTMVNRMEPCNFLLVFNGHLLALTDNLNICIYCARARKGKLCKEWNFCRAFPSLIVSQKKSECFFPQVNHCSALRQMMTFGLLL
jgi:hypothetical protein